MSSLSRLVHASVLAIVACLPAGAGELEQELGRNEVRVLSAPYPLVAGRTVAESALLERLERLGYERLSGRPERPGTFFFGHEVLWIYRREFRWSGSRRPAKLIGLQLDRRTGRIVGGLGPDRNAAALTGRAPHILEPELLAESLDGNRADRILVELDRLPDHVWQTLLAAEDARFFEHVGIDARSVARAALANVKRGGIAQGGSTITQQLIKNRDLSPKRSMGRKVSEAVRALFLEAEYDKREILQAYLNQVYYGHVSGMAIHGVGAAAHVYFSKPAHELTLGESALLAGIIQGPNRLSPIKHPQRSKQRRDWVLSRIEKLGWADVESVRRATDVAPRIRRSEPSRGAPLYFLSWVAAVADRKVPRRISKQRGMIVETTLDPYLQRIAETVVGEHLRRLRRDYPALKGKGLSAALVAVDVETGSVLAYVGGEPGREAGRFDRARNARRQPGSTVKPLVLLEAFNDCGTRDPLHVATRVADEPLRIDLPSGPWEPENYDGRYRGVVDMRTLIAESLNVPTVRVARWCGFRPTARTFERSGLELPDAPPPSFVLGAVETTPVELAGAYTVLATPGKAVTPHPVRRIEKPGGRMLARVRGDIRRVTRPTTAFLVRELLRGAVEDGTARGVAIDGLNVAAKTGSSSALRDAWLAGHAGSIVAVVWIGLDDGGRLGLTGGAAAGPLWRRFMEQAVPARPDRPVRMPHGIVERYVDSRTGLLVREFNRTARKEWFRLGALPPRDRFWRADAPVPVVH